MNIPVRQKKQLNAVRLKKKTIEKKQKTNGMIDNSYQKSDNIPSF